MAWYTAASGVTCVAAYDAVGAASLADSYTNEANPGTYTAAPGTAPTWAYGTGWTFNGTTQYLTTGVIPADGWSMIVRFSGVTNNGSMGAYTFSGGIESRFYLTPNRADGFRQYSHGATASFLRPGASISGGVMAMAAKTAYLNGASEGTIPAGSIATITEVLIGAANFTSGGGALSRINGSVQALAIYSGTLTLADVVAITAAMNALPAAAAAKGLPVIAHHYRQIFGG